MYCYFNKNEYVCNPKEKRLAMENYKKIIADVYNDVKNVQDLGQTARFIPELAFVGTDNFGVHITMKNKENFISKIVLTYFTSRILFLKNQSNITEINIKCEKDAHLIF